MAVSISSHTPGRGREGDSIVTAGLGFSATPGQNTVTVDGISASITAESATSITWTWPAGVTEDRFVVVRVTNLDDSTLADRYIWSKEDATTLLTVRVPGQYPGTSEVVGTEDPILAEAKDYERLATLVEEIRDVLGLQASDFAAKGDFLIGTGVGSFESAGSAATEGEVPVRRAAETSGWGFEAVSGSGGWGENTETLSADKTLTDSDGEKQFLDPNGTDRRVLLPALGSSNPVFFIYNTGFTAADLIVQSANGATVAIVSSQSALLVVSDGNRWAGFTQTIVSDAVRGYALRYGALNANTGEYLRSLGDAVDGDPGSTYDGLAALTVPSPGVIRRLGKRSQTSAAITWKIWKNGAASETIVESAASTATLSSAETFVAEGDTVAVEFDAGTSGQTTVGLHVLAEPTVLWFGENQSPAGAGNYLAAYASTSTTGSLSAEKEADTWENGTLDLLAWNVNVASAYDLKIWKNGAESETISIASANEGTAAAATSVAPGDEIAVEIDTVGSWQGTVGLRFVPTAEAGISYPFGGDPGATGQFFETNKNGSDGIASASITHLHEHLVLHEGRVQEIAYNTTSADSTTDVKVWKNGAVSETIELTGAEGREIATTVVAEEDTLALEYDAGTDPGEGNYQLITQ